MASTFEETQVIVGPNGWIALRKDERFIELMRLARVANSLSLAYEPLLTVCETFGHVTHVAQHGQLCLFEQRSVFQLVENQTDSLPQAVAEVPHAVEHLRPTTAVFVHGVGGEGRRHRG